MTSPLAVVIDRKRHLCSHKFQFIYKNVFSYVHFLHFDELKMHFLQIAPFRSWKYILKIFGYLDVIIRVAIRKERENTHFSTVISTNMFIGNIGIDN